MYNLNDKFLLGSLHILIYFLSSKIDFLYEQECLLNLDDSLLLMHLLCWSMRVGFYFLKSEYSYFHFKANSFRICLENESLWNSDIALLILHAVIILSLVAIKSIWENMSINVKQINARNCPINWSNIF